MFPLDKFKKHHPTWHAVWGSAFDTNIPDGEFYTHDVTNALTNVFAA